MASLRATLLILVCCLCLRAQAPDVILINGHIITVDPGDTIAQAVAITGGKITSVGTTAAVRPLAGPTTRIVDLQGKTATPGLIDTHCHFQAVAEIFDIRLDVPEVTRISDAVALVKARAQTAKPGAWIRGQGWDEAKFLEKRYLTAVDLDSVSPDNPVFLVHSTGHYAVANSYAMRLAGLTRATKAPPAGTIDRNAVGDPTGVLKESAVDLVSKEVPAYTKDERRQGLLRIIDEFHQEGMTGVKSVSMGPADWELYTELLHENKLTVRMFTLWSGGTTLASAREARDHLLALPRPPQAIDGILIAGGVKLFMDGSGGARTAWMYSDWNKNSTEVDTGNRGYPLIEPEVYRAQINMLQEAGIHVGTHSIGDRAIDFVVDTYAAALQAHPIKGLRHSIIHANTPTDHAIATMAALQKEYDAGYPELQPPFAWWLGDNYPGNLGPQRSLRLLPLHTFLTKGVLFTGGADYPVTPLAARYGIWSAVERRSLRGTWGAQPFGTAESIDVKTALKSYTIWAARQIFMEDRVGSIEPGKEADIAVWDRDPYSIPSNELRNLKCLLTLFHGQPVYDQLTH